MAAETARYSLGLFVDAAVELLEDTDLRLSPLTKHPFPAKQQALIERVLWELEDHDIPTVAKMFKLKVAIVRKISELPGARGGEQHQLAA